jgi:hypothetical protein
VSEWTAAGFVALAPEEGRRGVWESGKGHRILSPSSRARHSMPVYGSYRHQSLFGENDDDKDYYCGVSVESSC